MRGSSAMQDFFEQSNFLKPVEFTSGEEGDLVKIVSLNNKNYERGIIDGGKPLGPSLGS